MMKGTNRCEVVNWRQVQTTYWMYRAYIEIWLRYFSCNEFSLPRITKTAPKSIENLAKIEFWPFLHAPKRQDFGGFGEGLGNPKIDVKKQYVFGIDF